MTQTSERFSLFAKNGDEILFDLLCTPYAGGVNWLVEWRDVPMGHGHAAGHAAAKAAFIAYWHRVGATDAADDAEERNS